jgi:two-component sensor histidine kinase
VDSALALFLRAEKLSEGLRHPYWQEESQRLIGMTYLNKKDVAKSKAYFTQVVEARRRAGDKAGEITALLKTVSFVMNTVPGCQESECTERLGALERALTLSRQLEDKAREEIVLILIGSFHLSVGDFKKAEQMANEALAIQKRIGYKAINRAWHALTEDSGYHYISLSNAYYLMTDINESRLNLDQALLNYLNVIREIEQTGLLEELAFPYFFLGMTYFNLNQIDKSITYFQKSLMVSHLKGEVVVEKGLIRLMAKALLKQGKPTEALQVLADFTRQNIPLSSDAKTQFVLEFAQCYRALGQNQRAEQNYLEAIDRAKQSPWPTLTISTKYYASQFYVATGQYRKAGPLLKQVLDKLDPEKKGHLSSYKDAYLLQFKVDSALANYPSAIRYYQLHTALKDSTFNEARSKQVEQLTIQYETGKKEQEIKLKEKNIALLRQQNKSQKTQRNALVGGTGLLLAFLGLGYNRYRLKQRSNQLLEAQQQKLKVQHEELQAQQEVMEVQQQEISQKNSHLSAMVAEKDSLLSRQERLLAEKERLLKEIHHRVKNNLQVVMSLLNSQAASLEDKAALSAIQESQHRVQAMALIHQKLYQSEGVARIPMQEYIQEVVAYLSDSYCLDQPVRFQVEVESIELDVTQAVPLGLIINEAITNAFKYAFPDGRSGRVCLSLHRLATTRYELAISDNGVGLPAHYDPSRSRSLGMTLLHGFSGQLGGELTLTSQAGLTISLVFEEEQLSPSYARTDYAC